MKKLFTLLTLALLSIGSAWADDVTLFSADFSEDKWSSYTSENKITAETTVNGIYFKCTDYVANNALYFGGGGNMSSGRFCAIQLTGVNKSVKVTLTYNKSARVKYAFKEETSISNGGSGTDPGAGTSSELEYTMTGSGDKLTFYFYQQGSGAPNIVNTITITTPAASGKDDPELSVTPASKTLAVGGTQQITATRSGDGTITYASNNTNVATVSNTGLITAVGIGNATITTSVAETEDYDADSKTTTVIVKPADLTITKYATFNTSMTSSPEDYFTLTASSEFNTKYTGTYGGTNYTKGLKVKSSDATSISFTTKAVCDLVVVQSIASNATNYIKIDGSVFTTDYDDNSYYDDEANTIRVYTVKGLAAGAHAITAASELGLLYVGVTEPLDPALSVSPASASAFAYVVGNGPSVAQTFTVTGSNMTNNDITVSLQAGSSYYEISSDGSTYGTSNLTVATGATVYVRLKSGLALGDDAYAGTLRFANEGAENVDIALSGSVTNQTYAVTYDLNGAEGDAPTTSPKENGAEFALAAAPTRTCYTFNGWKCSIDGVTYTAGADYTMTAAATTFTAQWTANYSSSLDFAAIVEAGTTESNAINTFLASGNMVAENLGSSAWETSTEKSGFIGYKVKNSGAKVSFLAQADKIVTIVLGSVGDNATLKKNGVASTIAQKKADDAETFITFATAEDMVVSITTSSTQTVTLKQILITTGSASVKTKAGRSYATYVTPAKMDFASAAGITAYIATGLNGAQDAVLLQEVGVVDAGTPIIVKTETQGATVNVPVTDAAASDVSGNKLVAGDGVKAYNNEGNSYYYLASDLFHLANAGILQSGKAYLEIAGATAPQLSINFGETTGIDNVKASEFKANGEYYNLAGQRVAQPTKGLYIVNGRKVVIK